VNSETSRLTGRTYEHDVIIRLSGRVKKRQKKLSKRHYGTLHIISRAEAKFVFEKGCDVIIVGAGHEWNLRLSPEVRDYFEERRCGVILRPTWAAIRSFNHSKANKIGLMHVTC
jgi:hypothetical protein